MGFGGSAEGRCRNETETPNKSAQGSPSRVEVPSPSHNYHEIQLRVKLINFERADPTTGPLESLEKENWRDEREKGAEPFLLWPTAGLEEQDGCIITAAQSQMEPNVHIRKVMD